MRKVIALGLLASLLPTLAIARGNADAAAIETAVARCMRSEDLAEGLAAWTAKRPPVFHGR